MIFPNIASAARPDRLSSNKDKKYHIDMARWSLYRCNNQKLYWNLYKYYINFMFYTNRQWIMGEDLAPFLNDNVSPRYRIRWEFNVIENMVNRMAGQAIKTEYQRRAYNATPQADRRKEGEWAKIALVWNIAQQMPKLKDVLAAKYNLEDTIEKTRMAFDAQWIDYSEVAANNLIRNTEKRNKLSELKPELARDKSLAGISIVRDEFIGNKQCFERIEPSLFFYDTAALKADCSDGAYMGEIETPTAGEIVEIANLDAVYAKKVMDAQDTYSRYVVSSFNGLFNSPIGRIPTYRVFWRDIDKCEWGFIATEFGMSLFQRITEENEALLIPKESLDDNQKEQLKKAGKNLTKRGTILKYDETIRFCRFVPKELIGTDEDVVLGYGEEECQQSSSNDPFEKKYPYHVDTYLFKYGEIFTPLDSSIKPQRLLNRVVSIMESNLNQMRGNSTVFDKNLMVDDSGNDAEQEFQKKQNNGQPIGVDGSRTGGNIQNGIIQLNNAPALQQATSLINVVGMLKNMTTDNIGMNQSMLGTGNDESVGLTQNNVAQGNLIVEPFFAGMDNQFASIYDSIANRGRMYYAKSEQDLYEIAGAKEVNYIKFTKDMLLHTMQIELRRVSTEFMNIEQNNALLLQLRQVGMLGDTQVAELWGRAEGDEIAFAMRQYNQQKLQQQLSEQPQPSDLDKRLNVEMEKKKMDVQQQQATDQTKKQLAQYEWDRRDAKDIRSGVNKLMVNKMKEQSKGQDNNTMQ